MIPGRCFLGTLLTMITMTMDPPIMTQYLNKQHNHHQEHPVRADTSQRKPKIIIPMCLL
ncbi:UNVERIFIED_CONTAM: hypothetical protein FKN15_070748 [Acipenser sinensis]